MILTKPEDFEAMRAHALASGGWNEEEVAAWSDDEAHALARQWLAGDIRDGFDWPDDGCDAWERYEELCESGTVCSSLFRTETGNVFWTIGE